MNMQWEDATSADMAEIREIVGQRPPDFIGKKGNPIWASADMTLADFRLLLKSEGTLAPGPGSTLLQEILTKHGAFPNLKR